MNRVRPFFLRERKRLLKVCIVLPALAGIFSGTFLALQSRREKDHIQKLFNQGKTLLKKGKSEEALYAFRLLAKTYPRSSLAGQAYYECGKIHEFKGKKPQEALKEYRKALAFNRRSLTEKVKRKIKIYHSPVKGWYRLVVDSFPDPRYLSWPLIKKEYTGNPKLAEMDITLLLEGFSGMAENRKLRYLRARVYRWEKQDEKALKELTFLVRRFPGDPQTLLFHLEIADIHFQRRNFSEAMKILLPLTTKPVPSFYKSMANFGAGEIFFQQGKAEKSVSFYQKVTPLKLSSLFSQDQFFTKTPVELQLAKSFEHGHNSDMAVEQYDSFIYRNELTELELLKFPEDFIIFYEEFMNEALFSAARLVEKKNPQKAVAYYGKIRVDETKPDLAAAAWLSLGKLYMKANRTRPAIETLQRIIKMFPRHTLAAEALFLQAALVEQTGTVVESGYYATLLGRFPDSPFVLPVYYKYVLAKQKESNLQEHLLGYADRVEMEAARQFGYVVIKIINKSGREGTQGYDTHTVLADVNRFLGVFNQCVEELKKGSAKSFDKTSKLIQTMSKKALSREAYLKQCEGMKTLWDRKSKLEDKIKQHPKDAQAHLDMGELFLNLGYLDRAHGEFSQAAHLSPLTLEKIYKENVRHVSDGVGRILNGVSTKLKSMAEDKTEDDLKEEVNNFKVFLDASRKQLLILSSSLWWGLQGEMTLKRSDLQQALGLPVNNQEWPVIQKEYRMLIPFSSYQKEVQSSLFQGTLNLYGSLQRMSDVCVLYIQHDADPWKTWKEEQSEQDKFQMTTLEPFSGLGV